MPEPKRTVPCVLRKEGGIYVLDVSIPFAPKEDVNISQRGDELTIQVGWYKRKVILPRTLLGRPTLGAKFSAGQLTIRLGDRRQEG